MSGLGGLNKSPAGVVIGLVQLALPMVETPADLAAQTRRIVALVGKARRARLPLYLHGRSRRRPLSPALGR